MTEKVMGLFILDGKGNFDQGFIVSLKNYSGDLPSLSAMEDGVSGELPPAPDLPVLYETWKIAYRNYLDIRAYNPADNHPAAFIRERPVEINVSGDYQGWENQKQEAYHACTQAEKALLTRFHEWLNSADFGEVKDTLKAYLFQSKDKANRILIESNDKDFQKMPWQKWDLLKLFSLSEVGLSSPNFKKRYVPIKPKERARVLVILGQDANIQQKIQQLATANIEIKVVTTLAELDEPLWNEAWDIIVFNGHSGTSEKGTEGKFQLSQDQWLSISDIRNHLNKAIDQGLKLVIFNSCDGLGLAHQLGEGQQLYLPQIMVMRDLLPMPLAPIFLQYFFEEFIKGISLYSALRATRDRLEYPTIKDEYPCASWLPVICQNPAHLPPTWNDLRGVESGINWREVCEKVLEESRHITHRLTIDLLNGISNFVNKSKFHPKFIDSIFIQGKTFDSSSKDVNTFGDEDVNSEPETKNINYINVEEILRLVVFKGGEFVADYYDFDRICKILYPTHVKYSFNKAYSHYIQAENHERIDLPNHYGSLLLPCSSLMTQNISYLEDVITKTLPYSHFSVFVVPDNLYIHYCTYSDQTQNIIHCNRQTVNDLVRLNLKFNDLVKKGKLIFVPNTSAYVEENAWGHKVRMTSYAPYKQEFLDQQYIPMNYYDNDTNKFDQYEYLNFHKLILPYLKGISMNETLKIYDNETEIFTNFKDFFVKQITELQKVNEQERLREIIQECNYEVQKLMIEYQKLSKLKVMQEASIGFFAISFMSFLVSDNQEVRDIAAIVGSSSLLNSIKEYLKYQSHVLELNKGDFYIPFLFYKKTE